MLTNNLRPRNTTIAAYLLPSFVIYIIIFIVPAFMAIVLSFLRFSSIRDFNFTGLANYRFLIRDANVWLALKNNLFLIGVCLIGQIGIAFFLAALLSSPKIIGASLWRTLIYFPVTLSAIVIGYVWQMVYDYNYGIITKLLNIVNRSDLVVPWLAQDKTVMLCVCIPLIWQYIGFHLVIILSAMTSIDPEVYQMAEIDGASGFRRAVHITLPLIKNTLFVCILLCVSANMKAFDHIVSLTNGGPGYSSNVLALYAYNTSFKQMNMGYGSTVSVAIIVVTLILFFTFQKVAGFFKDKD